MKQLIVHKLFTDYFLAVSKTRIEIRWRLEILKIERVINSIRQD